MTFLSARPKESLNRVSRHLGSVRHENFLGSGSARSSADRTRWLSSGRRSPLRMFDSPAIRATKRSIPIAKPPCGGAPIRERLEQDSRTSRCLLVGHPHRPEDALAAPRRRWIPIEPGAELPAVPDRGRSAGSAHAGIALDPRSSSPGTGAVNGWCMNVQLPVLLVALEEREVERPSGRRRLRLVDQAELAAEVRAQRAEARARPIGSRRRRRARSIRGSRGTPRARLREELRDRRAHSRRRRRRGTRGPSRPTPSRPPRAARARARENACGTTR